MINTTGGNRAVIEGACSALREGKSATLALVIETEGSTYVRSGAIALFVEAGGQVGWLSGGCLEAQIAVQAQRAAAAATIEWMEIDTRDDEDLFAGSAIGCRGRLSLALLPLATLDGWCELAALWLEGAGPLEFRINTNGALGCRVGESSRHWNLQASAIERPPCPDPATSWQVRIAAPPRVLVFGAGPETPLLIPLLRSLGWMTTLIERRPRWLALTGLADTALCESPESAMTRLNLQTTQAALVMHHNFELDREALHALAASPVPFIGLLGPGRRRDDLFKLLPAESRASLLPRLHSPIGLKLGGSGPEAIALSIAAQLHHAVNSD